jgi:hypothetical protein
MANGKCAIHQHADRAKELARRSIESRRRAAAETRIKADIIAPRSPEELVSQLAQVFVEVKNGQLDVAVGRTMANVALVILKGFEVSDVKRQIEEIKVLLNQRA